MMHEIEIESKLLDFVIEQAALILAERHGRHPLWVRRRMHEEVDFIVSGGRPMGDLGMIAIDLAIQAAKQGFGFVFEHTYEPIVLKFPSGEPLPTPPSSASDQQAR